MSKRTVRIDMRQPSLTGADTPVEGSLVWAPTLIRHIETDDSDYIRLPVPFQVTLNGGRAEVTVPVPDGTWAWSVKELVPKGRTNGRLLHIPDGPEEEPLDYGDLVEIDPKSLDLVATPDPVWWARLMDVSDAVDALAARAPEIDPAELKALAADAVAEAIAANPPVGVTPAELATAINNAFGGGALVVTGSGPPPKGKPGDRLGQIYIDEETFDYYKLGG